MSSSSNGSNGRPTTITVWASLAALAVLLLGPAFVRVFRPPPDVHQDFVQEWLSARHYWAGDPVYLPEREGMQRRTGRDLAVLDERPWNAHPPVAVFAALPFGLIDDYRTAHLVWNLVTFPLFLLGVALILHELRVPWHAWSFIPAIVLIVADAPILSHLWQGQLNFPVLFLLSLGWIANRRGYRTGSGIAIGLATAFKLFPGLLLVHFLATRSWRQLLVSILTALLANAIAFGLFGWGAYGSYIREVLPSLEVFRGGWANVSVTGYWTRVFAAIGTPGIAPFVAGVFQTAIVATVAWAGWNATNQNDRDRAFALAVVGMPLASPVAWGHYFVILVMPLMLLWMRLPRGWTRLLFSIAVVLLLIPEGLYPGLYERFVPGSPDVTGLANHLPTPPDLGLCAIGLGVPMFALGVVFLLLAFNRLATTVVQSRDGP